VAIIIAPGGGFHHLSMSAEGYEAARVLADHGITAIVLKYRLNASAAPSHATPTVEGARPPPSDPNTSSGARLAKMDGEAAVRFVRAHASAWNIAPGRVGFLGFSAGGVVALHAAVSADQAARPDFVASIYGPMPRDAVVPATAPPLFLAVAADDRLEGPAGILPVFDAWRAAGRDVELHIFDAGGHGFGMTPQNTTSDHWIDEYLWWLQEKGLLQGDAGVRR
jgi:acetyl esterase/lipase